MSDTSIGRALAEADSLRTPQGRAELDRLRAERPDLADRIARVADELLTLGPATPLVPDRYGRGESRPVSSTHNRVTSRMFLP